jgi:hypothetical protein
MLTLVRVGADGERTPLYSMIPMPAPTDAYWRSWLETFRGARSQSPRLARRRGDELLRYDRDSRDCVWIEGCRGKRRVEAKSADLPDVLSEHFGISATWLRAHFASLGRRAAG